ncbi:MAG: hypothetical protein RLY71_4085 [Pseudomonadota bacterium]|jgi:cytochrome P450
MAREGFIGRWMRTLGYRALCSVVNQPILLRAVARLLRERPPLAAAAKVVVTRDDVAAVFDRQALFSSIAHQPNLVAGPFVISAESGPSQTAQRRGLEACLASPREFGIQAALASRDRIMPLRPGPVRRLDVTTDYMVPIAWACLRSCFGTALPDLASSDPLFAHLRHIGAHLIVGGAATQAVQERAVQSAIAVDAWIRPHLPQIRAARQAGPDVTDDELARDAVGLLWVGHPASVQALALIVLDLIRRPQWRVLAARAEQCLGPDAAGDPWDDAGLRSDVQAHVLESLRFRPPFPLLLRYVVRDGHMGSRPPRKVAARDSIRLLVLGAMFDPAAHVDPASAERYCPARKWRDPDDRELMFGIGPRPCIAREHVLEMLTSALIGLLLLPGPTLADPFWARFRIDGPAITRLRLRFGS